MRLEVRVKRRPVTAPILLFFTTAASLAQPNQSDQGGLNGLYWAYFPKQQFSYDLQGNPRLIRNYVLHWYYFLSNNRVHVGLPFDGLEDFSCEAQDARGRSVCQLYRIGGGTIQIGSDQALKFKRDGTRLEIEG